MGWQLELNANVAGGIVEGVGELLWFVCAPCMAGENLVKGINELSSAMSDWDGYVAEKDAAPNHTRKVR